MLTWAIVNAGGTHSHCTPPQTTRMTRWVNINEGSTDFFFFLLMKSHHQSCEKLFRNPHKFPSISRHADDLILEQCCTQFLTPCNTGHKLPLKTCKAVHKRNGLCLGPARWNWLHYLINRLGRRAYIQRASVYMKMESPPRGSRIWEINLSNDWSQQASELYKGQSQCYGYAIYLPASFLISHVCPLALDPPSSGLNIESVRHI